MTLIQIVVGFFATAGAAGVDFGMNSRDEKDVRWGGLVGILLAVLVAGGLPLLAVAGAHALFGVQDYQIRFSHRPNRQLRGHRILPVRDCFHCPHVLLFVYCGK